MSKYFKLFREIKFKYPNDMQYILNYLKQTGYILCSDKKIESLWEEFSETYAAGWLNPDDELLSNFATWLNDYDNDEADE